MAQDGFTGNHGLVLTHPRNSWLLGELPSLFGTAGPQGLEPGEPMPPGGRATTALGSISCQALHTPTERNGQNRTSVPGDFKSNWQIPGSFLLSLQAQEFSVTSHLGPWGR